MPDTAREVRVILGRALRELDEAIANPTVSSMLTILGSLLGIDDADSAAAPVPPAVRKSRSGASRRNQSAPGASRPPERCAWTGSVLGLTCARRLRFAGTGLRADECEQIISPDALAGATRVLCREEGIQERTS